MGRAGKIPRKTFDRSAYSAISEPGQAEARSIKGLESWALRPNRAGTVITPDIATTIGAAYACINVLCSDIGAMPFNVMRRAADGSRSIDFNSSYQDLVYSAPNERMTAQTWRECSVWHLCTRGNAFSRFGFDGLAEVERFDLLHPDLVTPAETKSGELYYQVDGENVPAAEILHFKAPGFNGVNGLSPIRQNAESMGLTLAVEGFGASYFANGINPSGLITFDGDPDEGNVEEIRKTAEARHAGFERAHRIMTLTGGAKWTPLGIKPEEAQFLVTRGYQLLETCRIFRVPPSKVQDFSHTSFASLEELNLDYYQSSLLPWFTRFEMELLRKLFPERRKRRVFSVEHDRRHLIRGRMVDQAEFWKTLANIGVMNANQIAAEIGLPPHDGGQYHFTQINQASDKALGSATLAEIKGVKPDAKAGPAATAEDDPAARSVKILPPPAVVDAALAALA